MIMLRINISLLVPVFFIIIILVDSFNHNYEDNPVESDVIVMLGGGDERRMAKSAELFKEGYADYIIITPIVDIRYSYENFETAIKYDIPISQIIADYEATNTYTNALRTIEIMEEQNFTSALVVTSDYHITRTKLIYDRVNDGSYTFRFIPALNADGEHWYDRSDAPRVWAIEFLKMWGYRFKLYEVRELLFGN